MKEDTFRLGKYTRHIIAVSILSIPLVVLFLSILFFSNVAPAVAVPATASSTFWKIDGAVYDTAIGSDGTIYVGGSFNYTGPNTGFGAPVNKTTGAVGTSFSNVSGGSQIRVAIPDGNNGWYIGGNFTTVGGYERQSVAHIDSNGVVDTNFNANVNANGDVYSLYLDSGNNRLFFGGNFSTVGGAVRNGLGVVNATTGAVIDWFANTDSSNHSIRAMVMSGTVLYVAGDFSTFASSSRSDLAAVDTSMIGTVNFGTSTSWNPSVQSFGSVEAMQLGTNTVYVGGSFDSIGGDSRPYVAEISLETGSSTSWRPNPNFSISAIEVDDNNVYVGGSFSTIGPDTRNYLAAISRTTGSSTSWNPNPNSTVYVLEKDATNLYVGGSFTTIGGESKNYISAFTLADNSLNSTFSIHSSASISALALSGSSLYIGGSGDSLGGYVRKNIAAFNPNTGKATSWDAFDPDGTVYAVAIDGETLYAGGAFNAVSSTVRNGIAAFSTSDASLLSWNPSVTGGMHEVRDIAVDTSVIYVGGGLTAVGGDSRNYLAAVDKTTGSSTSWDASLSGGFTGVTSIAKDADYLYIVGDFTQVGSNSRGKIAQVSKSTGAATSWEPTISGGFGALETIALGTSTVFIGGNFTTIGSNTRNYVAEIDLSSGSATAWNANASGGFSGVKAIALTTSTVYVAGDFTSIGGQGNDYIAALNRYTGDALTSFVPDGGNSNSLFYLNGSLFYGGGSGRYFSYFGPSKVEFASTTLSGLESSVTTATFTLQFANNVTSTQDVSVDYTVSGTATGSGTDYTLASGTATISAGNSTTTVLATIVGDATVESNETIVVSISNPQYAEINSDASTATYTILNDDVAPPGVTISETGGSTISTEGGATDTYTIVLDALPDSPVTLLIAESTGQVSLSTSSIVFTTSNWNTPVSVTVTAVNDDIAEGTHGATISHTATSGDSDYSGLTINSVSTTITDDSDTAGVTLTQSGGSTTVTEDGLSDTYTLVLTSQPTSTVTIALATVSSDITLSTSSIAFTASNWNSVATVTVSAENDASVEGTETATVIHTASSNNWNYNGLGVSSVSVSITDNDSESTDTGGVGRSQSSVTPPAIPEFVPQESNLPEAEPVEFVEIGDKESFQIGRESHSAELLSFSEERVVIIVRSEPIQVTIPKDGIQFVDTNKDGIPDVAITYRGIENNKPKVEIMNLVDENETKKAMTINKGAFKTNIQDVILDFNVENVAEVAISNSPSFASSILVPFKSSLPWKLGSVTGKKTIYVRLVSSSGGKIDVEDSIYYDPFNEIDPLKEAEKEKLKEQQKKEQEKQQALTVCPLSEGHAYKHSGSPIVYYILDSAHPDKLAPTQKCTKRAFQNFETFSQYFQTSEIQTVSKQILDAIPNDSVGFVPLGPNAKVESGSLLKKLSENKVYLLLGSGLHWLETERVFTTMGFAWNMVEDISSSLFSRFYGDTTINEKLNLPAGTFFRYKGDADIYRLELDNNKYPPRMIKRKLKNFDVLKNYGRPDRIPEISIDNVYPDGPVIE